MALLQAAWDHLQARRFADAEALYRQYLTTHPNHGEMVFNLGLVLHQQGRLDEAIAVYQHAVQCRPELLQAYQNMGHAFHTLSNYEAAGQCYHQALQLQPDHVEVLNNLGNVLKDMGRLDEAINLYARALAVNPSYGYVYNNLGNVYKELGMLDNAILSYQKALELAPIHVEPLGNLLFVSSYHPQCSPEQYLANAVRYGNLVASAARPHTDWPALARSPRLRVGLVSGDLRMHPIGYFLESILCHLDSQRIELVAYATKPQEDALTTRIKPYFSAWVALAGLNDEAAAQKIRADGVQILLDISGHTAHNRLPIFAWKPAPVQATWLGYFASTGLPQMDYLLADPVSVPETHQSHFTEAICYLPDTRLCFTAPVAPDVSSLPAQQRGYVTLGCFQNLSKVGNDVLAAWARILNAMPTAKLRLQNAQLSADAIKRHVLQRLAAQGIAEDRVILLGSVARAAYFEAHAEVDVLLDTFPYPGGTTTCEALWMGVPTVTLAGTTLLARQGASLLTSAGLQDWVAETVDDYVAKAIRYASNLDALAALRAGLRDRVRTSPLFDAVKFTDNFALALEAMWERKLLECEN